MRNTKAYNWLASVNPSSGLDVWYVYFYGSIYCNNYYCLGVRPVISLTSGVYIASGDGTEGNEYVLGKD